MRRIIIAILLMAGISFFYDYSNLCSGAWVSHVCGSR